MNNISYKHHGDIEGLNNHDTLKNNPITEKPLQLEIFWGLINFMKFMIKLNWSSTFLGKTENEDRSPVKTLQMTLNIE